MFRNAPRDLLPLSWMSFSKRKFLRSILPWLFVGIVNAEPQLAGAPQIRLTLKRLNVLGSVLMIGAHPDDEQTGTLAWFARGRGFETAYLSLTRGEGGQNLIGPEQGEALGVIRTQELLAARQASGPVCRAVSPAVRSSPQGAGRDPARQPPGR